MKKTLICVAAALIAMSCANKKTAMVPGIDINDLDTSIAPGADFYAYSTAGWQRNNPLKPEYSRFGSFDILGENNEIRLNELFAGLAEMKTKRGTDEQKIADLYKMALDSVRRNAEGVQPVKAYLEEIESVSDVKSFVESAAEISKSGNAGMWGVYVSADMLDSDVNMLYIGESGIALRNRDYYLTEQNAAIREGYKAFLAKIFSLAGYEDAAGRAQDAFEVEMKLAVPYWSMVQQRDVEAQYNPMTSEELYATYPALCLDSYMDILGIPAQQKLCVEQPSFFEALNGMIGKFSPAQLRHYLQAQVISGACGALSDDFSDASFEFFSRQLAGIQQQKPRWKRAMQAPNGILGEAVGKMYVAKYFPEKDKKHMLEMVHNMQAALSQHIDALEWMSDSTKAKAQEKLASFTVKIGYPDKWKDYSTLDIDPSKNYYDNLRTASAWFTQDNLNKLGKPVDREEWGMTPQTVNAYYNPTTNEICFPAGILQPPFYNPDADDAVNYGAIGVVICHEMTHGFDDQGRLFDKKGNMNNWWTEADAEAFNAKTQKLVEQFNQVEILPGTMANGAATLGENIADQGGLRIAYTAMQNSFCGRHPEPVDGFTAEQRFYLAYAKVWAQNITDQEKARRVLTDVHSIGEQRVNETLRNIADFFYAFDINEGDAMYRPESERVVIW